MDFYACLSQNVIKCDGSGRKSCCHVADAFFSRLKLLWPISSLKISKMSKKSVWVKSSRSQWVNEIHCTNHEMQAASCKLKTNKNERVIWGIEFGLTEMCFPSPGSRHKYKLTMAASLLFLLQIMGHSPWAPSLDLPLFSHIGRCRENSFDNLNIKPQYVKRIAMTFSFCWLFT